MQDFGKSCAAFYTKVTQLQVHQAQIIICKLFRSLLKMDRRSHKNLA